jgi:23S rRNA (adenine2503-C2)-methyltransferase
MADAPINLLDFSPEALAAYFVGLGEKPYRATQIIKWVHQQGVIDLDLMTNLSRDLRARLAAETTFRVPEIVTLQESDDGTLKWLLRVDNGNCIETVSGGMSGQLQFLRDRAARLQPQPLDR